MSRWVVRMCAAAGWLDVVDPDVVATYLERSTAVVEREPERCGQEQPSVPGIPPWVWATTGLCVATAVLLVMPRSARVETGLESVSSSESPPTAEPPVALQPLPSPRLHVPSLPTTVVRPAVSPAQPSLAVPSAPSPEVDCEAELPLHSPDTTLEREQARCALDAAIARLGKLTRVEPVGTSEAAALDIGAALTSAGGANAGGDHGTIERATAIRIRERMHAVSIEFDFGSDSGATLQIRDPSSSSKPETIGRWSSLAVARSALDDSLIRWYRRQVAQHREVADKNRQQAKDLFEIPTFGGRE